jgi:hypothetical protein
MGEGMEGFYPIRIQLFIKFIKRPYVELHMVYFVFFKSFVIKRICTERQLYIFVSALGCFAIFGRYPYSIR